MSSSSDIRSSREERNAPNKRPRRQYSPINPHNRASRYLRHTPNQHTSSSRHHRRNSSQYPQGPIPTPPRSFSPSSNGSFIGPSAPRSAPWQPSTSPGLALRKLGDTTFRYDPLHPSSREIRLLRILPETSSVIECEILYTSLLNPRPYMVRIHWSS
jgi:hypothetical protein